MKLNEEWKINENEYEWYLFSYNMRTHKRG